MATGQETTRARVVTTSAGSADEGKVPVLNSSGVLDNTVQPTAEVLTAGETITGATTPVPVRFGKEAYLTCDTAGESNYAVWAAINDGEIKLTIDGTEYDVQSIDFTGDTDMDDVAATIQAAIRTATSSTETCVWSTDHFIIASITNTMYSEVSVLTNSAGSGTEVSGSGFMNGQTGSGTATETEKVYMLKADDQEKLNCLGFAITNSTDGNDITVQYNGVITGLSSLSIGEDYYAQDTPGDIGLAADTYEAKVGVGISATELLIQKGSWEYIGTEAYSENNYENSGNAITGITLTNPLTMPKDARFAIIEIHCTTQQNNAYTGGRTSLNATIARNGAVAISNGGGFSTDQTLYFKFTPTLTPSTNSIAIVLTGPTVNSNNHGYAISGNAYYYK